MSPLLEVSPPYGPGCIPYAISVRSRTGLQDTRTPGPWGFAIRASFQEIVISQAPTEETVKKTLGLLELQTRSSGGVIKGVMNGVRQGYDGNNAGEDIELREDPATLSHASFILTIALAARPARPARRTQQHAAVTTPAGLQYQRAASCQNIECRRRPVASEVRKPSQSVLAAGRSPCPPKIRRCLLPTLRIAGHSGIHLEPPPIKHDTVTLTTCPRRCQPARGRCGQ